ncbi:MAG: hypothetical protein IJ348_06560 [Alistipes sp.]|nr:hypothetical protein [Alistipes sp.]
MKQLLAIFALLCTLSLGSCVKEPEVSGADLESRALRAWIKKNRPELLKNHQATGDYYVDVLEWGDASVAKDDNDFGGEPIMEQDTCWMIYNFTGYDLTGDVCVTRESLTARMQNTFSKNTHYVPYLNYCGSTNMYSLLEGTYLSTRNVLKLDEEYVQSKGFPSSDFAMRKGAKVRLYLPSSVGYGATGTTQEGGYEGQFHLDTNVPVIMDVEVVRVVKNPSDLEVSMVETVVKDANTRAGKDIWLTVQTESNTDSSEESEDSSSSSSTETETYTGLYYTTEYEPGNETLSPAYMTVADAEVGTCYEDSFDTGRYADMKALDEAIVKALDEKFADMELAADDENAKVIGKDGSTTIWYIARFLDGFILDTNIPEVRELVFDSSDDSTSSLTYTASTNKDDYVGAWYHCIPKLKYGRWGAIITTSGYAYGAEGISGSTSSSSTSSNVGYYDYGYGYGYYDYYNYYNSYSYPYYMSYPIYDTPSYTYDGDTGSISTEVQPYTPLVFYIFVEPTESEE